MQPPDCLKGWTRSSRYSWRDGNYSVSVAKADRIVWDAWVGMTTRTSVAEQIDGGLASADEAVAACRRHAEGRA